jgi:hypothetical protein
VDCGAVVAVLCVADGERARGMGDAYFGSYVDVGVHEIMLQVGDQLMRVWEGRGACLNQMREAGCGAESGVPRVDGCCAARASTRCVAGATTDLVGWRSPPMWTRSTAAVVMVSMWM